MRPTSLLITAAAVAVLAGCTQPAARPKGYAPVAVPTSAAPATTAPAPSERAAVLIAVLRNHFTEGRSDAPPHSVVYVMDHTDANAADPMPHQGGTEPISTADQQAIIEGLTGIMTITFVHDGKNVIESPAGCPQVRGGASLVTLGTPVVAGHNRNVAFAEFRACLDGLWLTYVVSPDNGWHVTGTTGGVSMA
jgi:hypothetical protein